MAQRRRQGGQRRQGQAGPGEQRQKVNKNEAINTLHAMFEHIDREVVKMVLLESCSGNMEAAVEALLIMSGGDSGPAPPQTQPQPQPQPQQPYQQRPGRQGQGRTGAQLRRVEAQQSQLQQQQAYATQLQQQYMQRGARSQSVPSGPQPQPQQRASLSVNLPDDFLRPPSYFLSQYDDPELEAPDAQSERERQIIEDEIFAKQLFESSIFASDLAAHPEWVTDDSVAAPKPSKQLSRARARSAQASNEQSTSKFKKMFRRRSSQANAVPTASESPSTDGSPGPQEVDPTNPMERQKSFKSKVNSLGRGAKERLAIFAEKLKRHKERKNRTKTVTYNSHKYHSALSLDDEPLLEDDLGPVEQASENNRGTYVPPKPSQDL